MVRDGGGDSDGRSGRGGGEEKRLRFFDGSGVGAGMADEAADAFVDEKGVGAEAGVVTERVNGDRGSVKQTGKGDGRTGRRLLLCRRRRSRRGGSQSLR
jgi:hypothetical protein